jgi:hypothetical protein
MKLFIMGMAVKTVIKQVLLVGWLCMNYGVLMAIIKSGVATADIHQ